MMESQQQIKVFTATSTGQWESRFRNHPIRTRLLAHVASQPNKTQSQTATTNMAVSPFSLFPERCWTEEKEKALIAFFSRESPLLLPDPLPHSRDFCRRRLWRRGCGIGNIICGNGCWWPTRGFVAMGDIWQRQQLRQECSTSCLDRSSRREKSNFFFREVFTGTFRDATLFLPRRNVFSVALTPWRQPCIVGGSWPGPMYRLIYTYYDDVYS